MTNSLVDKRSVTWTFVAPSDEAADILRTFFDGHLEFMKVKCVKDGDKKLVNYYVSEAPEYSDEKEEFGKWFSGKYPQKTGRTVFVLKEICETEEGLHHHYIEAAPTSDVFETMINSYGIELKTYNQMKIRQSLWD